MSKATARWVGFSFWSRLISIDDEAVDGVGVLPVAVLEAVDRQGVEGPECQRMAVDDAEG